MTNKLPLFQEETESEPKGSFPKWLHRDLPKGKTSFRTDTILRKYQLNTVCEEAKCPNRAECYSKLTATFLAMGKDCTRSCGFCDIDFSKTPKPLESDEPERIALSVKELGLKHVVITMVARDDLADQGALHIARIIDTIRTENPNVTTEVLTSDFNGDFTSLDRLLHARPEIFNHNIETVERLTPKVRHVATYRRTLSILAHAKKNPNIFIKSGLMLGLGETSDEVKQTLQDLADVGCDIVTLGQYLRPNKKKLRLKAFITPEMFDQYKEYGLSLGIPHIYAGPFVRSSYNADQVFSQLQKKKRCP
jgi:lipoyl synthase